MALPGISSAVGGVRDVETAASLETLAPLLGAIDPSLPAHTPGPWSHQPSEPDASGKPITWYVVRGEGRYDPAIANTWPASEYPERDARIMAAAPALLAACRAGLHALRIEADHRSEIEDLEVAIAKALGPSAQDTSDAEEGPGGPET